MTPGLHINTPPPAVCIVLYGGDSRYCSNHTKLSTVYAESKYKKTLHIHEHFASQPKSITFADCQHFEPIRVCPSYTQPKQN